MPGQGRAPKERRAHPSNDRQRQAEMTHLEPDGYVRGPELPDDVLPNGEEWHPATLRWWETWRLSAQSQTFTETDWRFLLDTALMHHTMWSKGRWEYAGELRLRCGKFGATPEDRMRLKQKVHTPADGDAEAPPEIGSAASARRRDLRITG